MHILQQSSVFVQLSVHAAMCMTDHLVWKCWKKAFGVIELQTINSIKNTLSEPGPISNPEA